MSAPPDVPGQNPSIGVMPPEDAHGTCPTCTPGANDSKLNAGNPINVLSLNKYQVETDFVGPGALPLKIVRHYSSTYADAAVNKGAFGQGWTASFRERLAAIEIPANPSAATPYEVVIENESGSRFRITSDDNQQWYSSGGRPVNFNWDSVNELFIWVDNGLIKLFVDSGDLASITHPNGETLAFVYNATASPSELTSITHSSGAALTFAYDSSNRITSITDPAGEVYQYFYDSNGNLDYVLRPNEDTSTSKVDYLYQISALPNALTAIKDEWNGVMRWTSGYYYDSLGQAIMTGQDAGGMFEKYIITPIANATYLEREVRHAARVFTYLYHNDIAGAPRIKEIQLLGTSSVAASTRTFTYDANGRYDVLTDEEGNVTDYNFDDRGHMTSMTTGVGTPEVRTVTYEWDATWSQVTKITTPLLVTEITLDVGGLPERIKMTNMSTYGIANQVRQWDITTVRYTNSSIIQTQTIDGPQAGASDITTFAFDTSGRLTSITEKVTSSLNLVTSFSDYDAYGRAGRITYPSGLVREFDYNPRGQVLQAREIVGAVTRTVTSEYYEAGPLEKTVFSDGSSLEYIQSGYFFPWKIIQDDGDTDLTDIRWQRIFYGGSMLNGVQKWEKYNGTDTMRYEVDYDYDGHRRLSKINYNAAGRYQEFTYDKLHQLNSTKDSYGRVTTYSYDGNRQQDSTTFRDGGVSQTTYDANGHINGIKDALGQWTYYHRDGFGQAWQIISPATGTTNYEYDAAGNLAKKTDARGIAITYEYDALNRRTATKKGSTTLESFTYDTNQPGYLYQITDNAGTHTFTRNDAGELLTKSSVLSGSTLSTGYSYDAHGRLETITYPSGLVVTYIFNSFGEIDKVKAQGASLPLSTVVFLVQYHPFGPMKRFNHQTGGGRTYLYDQDYTLTRLNSGNFAAISRPLTRDLNGNITAFDSRAMTYDNMDRLQTHSGPDGTYEYNYDLNGNRNWHKLNAAQTTYNYNGAKTQLSSLSGATTESRSYDANGNTIQIGSRYFDHNDLNRFWRYREGSTTFTYKHNAFGERQIKDDGTVTTRFVYNGPNLLHEDDGTTERDYIYLNGEIVAMVKGGIVYNIHADQVGRPEAVTTGTYNNFVWQSENNAFGNNPGTDLIGGMNIGFPGQYYDIESATYYNYFRTYDANTGRYLQSDPIGLADGLNTYSYTSNNPVGFVDDLGLGKARSQVQQLTPAQETVRRQQSQRRLRPAELEDLLNHIQYSSQQAQINRAMNRAQTRLDRAIQARREDQEALESIDEVTDILDDVEEIKIAEEVASRISPPSSPVSLPNINDIFSVDVNIWRFGVITTDSRCIFIPESNSDVGPTR